MLPAQPGAEYRLLPAEQARSARVRRVGDSLVVDELERGNHRNQRFTVAN